MMNDKINSHESVFIELNELRKSIDNIDASLI